jgi:hypothetical protein
MATEQTPTGEREWRPSRNLPPFTRLDLAGIAVAVIGTAALILLAAGTADSDTQGLVPAARMLLAIGATLINLAHVVGIIFFESVNYHGPFQKLFAKMSLYGTPLALLVSLGIGLV